MRMRVDHLRGAPARRTSPPGSIARDVAATSFATLGQMRANEGDVDAALSLLDQGTELCQQGSEFELYLLVLKTRALLAAGEREALDGALDVFYARRAGPREYFAIFYTPTEPDRIAPEALQMLERIDANLARISLV